MPGIAFQAAKIMALSLSFLMGLTGAGALADSGGGELPPEPQTLPTVIANPNSDEPDPFAPYTPPEMPPRPYTRVPADDTAKLLGDWHYYINPRVVTLPRPTVQLRFEKGRMILSLGTLGTDSGLFFAGPWEMTRDGVVEAELRREKLAEGPEGPVVKLRLLAYTTGEAGTMVFVLGPPEVTGDKTFDYAFSEFYDSSVPFARYQP